MKFKSPLLEEAVNRAKKMGLKVWAFQTTEISEIFVDDGTSCGAISNNDESLQYMTKHVPNPITGNGFLMEDTPTVSRELINACFAPAPYWARNYHVVKESFMNHIKHSKLNYYRL